MSMEEPHLQKYYLDHWNLFQVPQVAEEPSDVSPRHAAINQIDHQYPPVNSVQKEYQTAPFTAL